MIFSSYMDEFNLNSICKRPIFKIGLKEEEQTLVYVIQANEVASIGENDIWSKRRVGKKNSKVVVPFLTLRPSKQNIMGLNPTLHAQVIDCLKSVALQTRAHVSLGFYIKGFFMFLT